MRQGDARPSGGGRTTEVPRRAMQTLQGWARRTDNLGRAQVPERMGTDR
jgi:hypothetical protein